MLEPVTRAFLRIPFLYQKVVATSPITALISTKLPSTALAVVHLDGSLDWMLAGKALLAWTGQTLSVRPTLDRRMVNTRLHTSTASADPSRASRTGVAQKSPVEAC